MKSVLLIGLGRFGMNVARKLSELGHEVMAIDTDEARINKALPYVTNAQIGDSTDADFLRSLGIDNYDVCIVAIGGDFQSSLITTSNLKELGAKMVVARASREIQRKFLLNNGADEVVYPELQMANWTAVRFTSSQILDYMVINNDYSIYELDVPTAWDGKTVLQLDLRRKYGFNIIAVKENGVLNMGVTAETVFKDDQSILVLGRNDKIQKVFNI